MEVEVESSRPRGRPGQTWTEMLDDDMRKLALSPVDVVINFWRGRISGAKGPVTVP
jgi:hypothetical protein